MSIIYRIFGNIFFYQILSVALLIVSMSNTANAKNLVYENNWAYLADTVMGGVSQGSAEFAAGALRLTGQVSTKNNGGFIQVRTRIAPSEPRGKTGIKIKVKGNGDVYYLHINVQYLYLIYQILCSLFLQAHCKDLYSQLPFYILHKKYFRYFLYW